MSSKYHFQNNHQAPFAVFAELSDPRKTFREGHATPIHLLVPANPTLHRDPVVPDNANDKSRDKEQCLKHHFGT